MNPEGLKIVVTGAGGHIGSHVARRLCESGFCVNLLIRRTTPAIIELAQRGAKVHVVDLFKPETYAAILQDADVLFHLAAENTTDQLGVERVLRNTVGLAQTVLTTAFEKKVRTVVYTSSVVVLGRSTYPKRLITENDRVAVGESPYVQGKIEAERFCEELIRKDGMDIRRVYPAWVAGPGTNHPTPPHQLVGRYLQKGQPFVFAGGISIAGVEAVAEGHIQAWQRGKPGESYLLGGDNITFKQFFQLLAQHAGKAPTKLQLPQWMILLAAHMLKAAMKPLGRQPPLDPAYAKTVIGNYSWYDSAKAKRELGYKIAPAFESLEKAVLEERKRAVGTLHLGKSSSFAAAPTTEAEAAPLLITGVPGWLGNRFVDVLARGHFAGKDLPRRKIRLLTEKRNAKLLNLPPNFDVVTGDICDPATVNAALEGIHTVFHLAGAIYPPHIKTLYRVNAEGTRNLVDQCILRGVRRILFMGTDSICGHGTPAKRIFDEHAPDTPYRHYGRSKWMAEKYILEQSAAGKIDGTSIRGFWFFGPFAPLRQQGFLNMMRGKRQIVFGNGKNFRSISHVDNTLAAFLAAENSPKTYGKWYWIGDRKADYTVDEIYSTLCEAAGSKYRPFYIPRIACWCARFVDSILARFGRLHPTIHGIGKFDFDIAGTTDAARRDFEYSPVISLREYAAQEYGQKNP